MRLVLPLPFSLRAASIALAGLLILFGTSAHAQLEMQASPGAVTSGAQARIAGSDAPGGTLQLRLLDGSGMMLTQSPGFTASAGQFNTALNVPQNALPGGYTVQLAAGGAVVGSTPLTLLPELVVEAPAAPVQLGTQFGFTVDDLRPGQLVLQIDGITIAGPFNVSGPRFEGFVLLPAGIGSPGGAVELQALNQVGQQTIGFGKRRILLAGSAPGALPRLDNLQFPSGGVIPMNAPWPVSGKLILTDRSPAGLEARLFMRLSSGRMLPLSLARAPVAADGTFSVIGDLAALYRNGIHVDLGETGDSFLVFVEPERPETGSRRGAYHQAFPLGPVVVQSSSGSPNPTLTVEVLDADGNPLQDALVILDVPGRWEASLGQPDLGRATPDQANRSPDDLPDEIPPRVPESLTLVSGNSAVFQAGTSQLRAAILSMQQPGTGIGGGQGCPQTLERGTTDAQGRFSTEIDRESLQLWSAAFAIGQGVVNQGNKSDIEHVPVEIKFRVMINAIPAGHTYSDSSFEPQGGEYFVVYRESSERFFGWSDTTKDYTVPLGQNPILTFRAPRPYLGEAVYPLLVDLGPMPKLSGQRYGPTVTFPEPVPFSIVDKNWLITVSTNEVLFGVIDWMELECISGCDSPTIWPMSRGNLSCASNEDSTFLAVVDGVRLPHSGPNGLRFRIRVKQQGLPAAQAFTYDFRLLTEPAPTWFLTADLDQRDLYWAPEEVRMTGSKTRPQQSVSGTPEGAGVGNLSNESQAVDRFSQRQLPAGLDGLYRTTDSSNRGANTDAAPASLGTPQLGIWIPWGPETILDTGTLPLFRMAWGVPPIAAATFGADARFWATLEIEARSDINLDTGVLSASLKTTPTVSGNIEAFFNFSAILGLVTMEASFAPEFSVAMPTTVSNNQPAEARECMTFRIWLEFVVSVGICPLCLEAGGEGDAFDPLVEPDNTNWCQGPPTPPNRLAAPLSRTRALASLRKPSASFDSLGAGSLIEMSGDGRLRQRVWTGSGFGAAQFIDQEVGVDEVVHAYYAPGDALMVYAASTLSQSAFLASSLAQGSSSRRLQFRTLLPDGSWTAPARVAPSAAPVGGDGKPALAVCAAGQAGCAAGGEAYAVWLSGTQSDPFSLATEVWGARFAAGVWSSAQRLANAGTGSDQLPRVTYLNGTPVVSFVRQPTRSLGAAGQRRLMLLRVGIDSQPIDLQAPDGVIWQDIGVNPQGQLVLSYTVADDPDAVIGDNNWLYAAVGSCGSSSCSLTHTRQRDGFGRDIKAESPQIVRTGQGIQIAYRGLGYGPDASGQNHLPGDTVGTVDGTGEFMSLVPIFSPAASSAPLPISGDGALHFNPLLIRQPISGALIGLSNTLAAARAGDESLAGRLPFELARGAANSRQLEADLTEFLLIDGPDLLLLSAASDDPWAEPGGTVTLTLLVENRGPRVAIPASFGVSWGGPWDSGVPQERFVLPAFGDSSTLLLDLPVPVPAEFRGRGPREVYLQLDPIGNSGDADPSNNRVVLELGPLPVPERLRFYTALDERHSLIEWDSADDERVRGFQVYREFGEGNWQPIGASEVNGFVDLMTLLGEDYRYRVASYDEDGAESDLSAPLTVQARITTDVIFESSFER